MCKTEEPASFREQVEAKGRLVQTLVSLAIVSGAGVGFVRAHTDPVFTAVTDKLKGMVPESLVMAGHAYHHAKLDSKAEETAAMVKRAAARTWRRGKEAAKAAFA